MTCPCLYGVLVSLASSCILFGCSLGRSVCGFVAQDARVGWHPSYLDSRPTISLDVVYELYRVSYDVRTRPASWFLNCSESCLVVCEDDQPVLLVSSLCVFVCNLKGQPDAL